MSDFKIFFKTRVENTGFLSGVGNAGLLPLQYLCDGDKVTIATEPGHKITMHPIFDKRFDSLCMKMLKTLAAVALLVPGLFLSLFKLAAYASSDVRKTHALVKETIALSNHPARRIRTIGSKEAPIKTIDALKEELERAATDAEAQSCPDNLKGALIIYGDGSLEISEDPGILRLDPKRLILIGAEIVHKSANRALDDQLRETEEWVVPRVRVNMSRQTDDGLIFIKSNIDASCAQQNCVATLDEALQDDEHDSRPLRKIYTVRGIAPDDTVRRISLDDVARIKIGQICRNTIPCGHDCIISLTDGRTAPTRDSYDIPQILARIPQEKIDGEKDWGPTEIREHFREHKSRGANEVLNALHFAKPSSQAVADEAARAHLS